MEKKGRQSNYDKDLPITLDNIPFFMKEQLRTMLGLTASIRLGLTAFTLVGKTNEERHFALNKRFMVRVPDDCTTLEEAIATVNKYSNLTTIVLMKGYHRMGNYSLSIPSTMNIVGDPNVQKHDIMVDGSFSIDENVQGHFHLQNMKIRKGHWAGVVVESSVLTMEDVVVEFCAKGIYVTSTGIVRCTNVELLRGGIGIEVEEGGSITLVGPDMKVHDNDVGLNLYGTPPVQLVSPLTKEKVFYNNKETYPSFQSLQPSFQSLQRTYIQIIEEDTSSGESKKNLHLRLL
jgi:hypothetical protein